MKTYDEYQDNIRKKAAKIKKRRRIIASTVAGTLALTLCLGLFWPLDKGLPSTDKWKDSPYSDLIDWINQDRYQPPKYQNNYEKLKAALKNLGEKTSGDVWDAVDDAFAPGDNANGDAMEGGNQTYEEVTDNQVAGVIEGDLFKRSDKYLYYLRRDSEKIGLSVYSIEGENSRTVGTFTLGNDSDKLRGNLEMYLSEDCTAVTVLSEGYNKSFGSFTYVAVLNVEDPENMTCTASRYFPGSYISSRLVDGDILLTYNYNIDIANADFDKPETFVPTYGTADGLLTVSGEDIVIPNEPTSSRYTVLSKLDGKTLELHGTKALLSYSQEIYVSTNAIYATCTSTEKTEGEGGAYSTDVVTQITGISYADRDLKVLGTVEVEGEIKDQYSLDEYNGILRVATSTVCRRYEPYRNDRYDSAYVRLTEAVSNCDLYCIDLKSWEIVGSVLHFAPDGDEITSVRFDGNNAYICTAERIVLTDPVYFFDLSDVKNITHTDTGIIGGYSDSLINFGNYLLGIGVNERGQMKIEVYAEGETGVESVAVYEREATAASEYKAYFIDRENGLLGVPIYDWNGETMEEQNRYLLLFFDGYKLQELKEIVFTPYSWHRNDVRATVIGDYLYLLDGGLTVEKVW